MKCQTPNDKSWFRSLRFVNALIFAEYQDKEIAMFRIWLILVKITKVKNTESLDRRLCEHAQRINIYDT